MKNKTITPEILAAYRIGKQQDSAFFLGMLTVINLIQFAYSGQAICFIAGIVSTIGATVNYYGAKKLKKDFNLQDL